MNWNYKGTGNICVIVWTNSREILYENVENIKINLDKRNKFAVQITKSAGHYHYFGPECKILAQWTTA